MIHPDIPYMILLSLPAHTALICALLLIRMLWLKQSPSGLRKQALPLASHLVSMLAWGLLIIYVTAQHVHVALSASLLLAGQLTYVISYRFVFEITKVNLSEKFTYAHYLFALLSFTLTLTGLFFAPHSACAALPQRESVVGGGGGNPPLIFAGISLVLPLCVNLIYLLLSVRRIGRYRKVIVNYSADEYRGSVGWLYLFIYATFAAPIFVAGVLIVPGISHVPLWILFVPAVLSIFRNTIVAYNILLENIVTMDINTVDATPQPGEAELEIDQTLKIRSLNAYMHKHKPYLNPRLKITEITMELNTNRTSLSILINRTYGMNFCRYINRFRLEEFEKIKSNPKNANLSEVELVAKAGFSDYRGYRRVKQREENT